jgi:thiamine biosynthesis lipoprotein
MGMPVTLEVVEPTVTQELFEAVFAYFESVDRRFSTYKAGSEISRINRGELTLEAASPDMKTMFELAEQARKKTHGYFNIRRGEISDPSGLVKGWAIQHAAEMVRQSGFKNFYVEAGGDFEVAGKNGQGQDWRVGIRNPFNPDEIVKVLAISERGIATSGTYVRGQHIYNPKNVAAAIADIVSLTVIGPNIYEADCYATAAFAMGRKGIHFIEKLEGFEGYLIDSNRQATFTSDFARYVYYD